MIHLLKVIRVTRGQSQGFEPYEIGRFTRIKEAKGQAKAARNSFMELLLEKFWEPEYIPHYIEIGEGFYILLIEDMEGIYHECQIFVESLPEELGSK